MRTSKKQMHELDEIFRSTFDNSMVYAAGEYNATGKAYIRLNGEIMEYENNTAAFDAAVEILAKHDGIAF